MNRPQANIAILAAAATAGAPGEVAQALTKIALPRREARATTPLTDALYASVDAAFIGQNVYLYLCLGEPRHGLSRSGLCRKTRARAPATGSGVHHLRANDGICANVRGHQAPSDSTHQDLGWVSIPVDRSR